MQNFSHACMLAYDIVCVCVRSRGCACTPEREGERKKGELRRKKFCRRKERVESMRWNKESWKINLKSIFNEDLNNTARSETRFVIEDGEDKQVPSPMTPTVDSRVLSLITHAADRQVITLLVAATIDVIVDDICVVGGASCVRVDIASSRQICRDLSGLALDDQFHKSNMC